MLYCYYSGLLRSIFNIIALFIFSLSSIFLYNKKLYAEAKDTDGVSIIRFGVDSSCISECNSISESTVKGAASYLGDSGVRKSDFCVDKNSSKDECNSAYNARTLCKGPSYSGDRLISLFYVHTGPFFVRWSDDNISTEYAATCDRVYKTYCYVDSPIHLEVSVGTSGSYSSEADVVSKVQKVCRDKVGEFRSTCKTRCSAYKLKMGNREINTVRDLLDSVPTTEFLKVYDPNMVNY